MSLLTPWALLWLASVPVLLWLWRLVSTHRHVAVPSLIPFEQLLRRPASRRTRLVVNALFWLQLAALLGLTFALTQPFVSQRRAKTILAILDTSASMGARLHGPSAFERAQQALLSRIAHKAPADQVFIMTTAPIAALIPRPTSDAATIRRAVQEARVNPLSGDLATTARVGRALLGVAPDDTVVATDELQPAAPLAAGVRWLSVGEPLPNAAIVGLEAGGSLCDPADARLVATIQNFSTQAQSVAATAMQSGRRLAEVKEELAPRARRALALALPEGTTGWVEVTLASRPDGLEVDNRAWIEVRKSATLPIVIRSDSASFRQTLSAWLGSCQALKWGFDDMPGNRAHLMVTDHEQNLLPSTAAALTFVPPTKPSPALSRWLVSSNHSIGVYLAPIETVSASLNVSEGAAVSGIPVVSGLVDGRKVPIVVAHEDGDRRRVAMFLDPAGSKDSTPMLLTFFNSLRWLMGNSDALTTGEHVNVFDPSESDLIDRASTWRAMQASVPVRSATNRFTFSLANLLIAVLLVLLLIEWWRYSAKGNVKISNFELGIANSKTLESALRTPQSTIRAR